MKTRHLIFGMLSLLGSFTAHAYDAEINCIYYDLSESYPYNEAIVTYKEYESYPNYNYISDYTGTIVIPESVTYNDKTYRVTKIGAHAFDNSDVVSVTIPNRVESINDYAFQNCSSLTSVSIPNSLSSIGDYAFRNCCNLSSVTIPNSITSMGESALQGCYFASSSFINNSSLASNNNWGATLCEEETSDGLLISSGSIIKCRTWATSVTIPNGVTKIGSNAFSGCSGLTSVTIPNSVTTIGQYAFYGCI